MMGGFRLLAFFLVMMCVVVLVWAADSSVPSGRRGKEPVEDDCTDQVVDHYRYLEQ
jgi:hypothetical protein